MLLIWSLRLYYDSVLFMLLMCYLLFSYGSCLYFDSEYPLGNFLEESKFDELSKFLQSHFQKNNAVNTMDESNIPIHALIFWCGWETNSIHTIFSYLFTSLSNDMRCGKTLARWLFKQSNKIYGVPPQFLKISKQNPNFWISLLVHSLSTERTLWTKKV